DDGELALVLGNDDGSWRGKGRAIAVALSVVCEMNDPALRARARDDDHAVVEESRVLRDEPVLGHGEPREMRLENDRLPREHVGDGPYLYAARIGLRRVRASVLDSDAPPWKAFEGGHRRAGCRIGRVRSSKYARERREAKRLVPCRREARRLEVRPCRRAPCF